MILAIGRFRFPVCDSCGMPLKLHREDGFCEEEENEWEPAPLHRCGICDARIFDECWRESDPCRHCWTQPCERGGECWWQPPNHVFPYLSYVAEPAVMLDLAPDRAHSDREPEHTKGPDCELCALKETEAMERLDEIPFAEDRLREQKKHFELIGRSESFLEGFEAAILELDSLKRR